MKTEISQNETNLQETNMPEGRKYWRSLDELVETPGFRTWLDREFPEGASEIDGVDRRQFLKVMAASFALAGVGLGGCFRQPKSHILPYSKQVEQIVPGVPIFYTSSMPSGKDNIPLIVETHDARPTKIEGNPSYTRYNGGTDLFAQASVLNLYDPDRSRQASDAAGKVLDDEALWQLLDSVHEEFSKNGGEGLAILAEPSSSPTRARLVREFHQVFPNAEWVEYDPTANNEESVVLGKQLQYKDALSKNEPEILVRPVYHLNKAKRVLSLDSDFLHNVPGSLGNSKEFAQARRVRNTGDAKAMNRLYCVESNFTLTGGMADHRLRVASSHIPAFTALLAAELAELAGDHNLVADLRAHGDSLQLDQKWIVECAQDLYQHRGESIVIGGQDLPAETLFIIAYMNQVLEGNGKTYRYIQLPNESTTTIQQLAENLKDNKVNTLVVMGGNPVYDAPALLEWKALQAAVSKVIRIGYYNDETSKLAHYHIPSSHYLESWGDGTTFDGYYVPVQPMIMPLFDTYSENELLARLVGRKNTDGYVLLSETFTALNPSISIQEWLSVGVSPEPLYPVVNVTIQDNHVSRVVKSVAASENHSLSAQSLEVKLVPSCQVWDGRYNNNGWLQECPEPLTKLTWDNAILISPRLAKELMESTGVPLIPSLNVMNKIGQMQPDINISEAGKEHAYVAEVEVNGRKIRGPLHIQPGLADYTIVLTLGYGRTATGNVGTGTGFDAYPLSTDSVTKPMTGASIRVTTEIYKLANTQQHWSMEGRAIIRESNSEDYQHDPEFVSKMCVEAHSPAVYGSAKNEPLEVKVKEIPRGGSLYKTPEFTGLQQWGMSIDLNTCIGCNSCVVACQSENNLPVIGKDQVLRGREMHWIRMDRYYSSNQGNTTEIPSDPQVSFMSMLCQHCELAPCETVCPVNATVHDDSGLNVMAYNRCVGTRYCANNCPYKVRRFNFFDWNKRQIGHFYEGPMGPSGMPELHKMQKNPNVSVRMRGVMEKCTFCVQRIESAKIQQRVLAKDSPNVKVPDGVIKTACQQVCPTESIVFGDVADPTTHVSQLKNTDLNYSVLGYLNTRPRTTYLARIRNPNPKMPDYYEQPRSRQEYENRYGHGTHHEA